MVSSEHPRTRSYGAVRPVKVVSMVTPRKKIPLSQEEVAEGRARVAAAAEAHREQARAMALRNRWRAKAMDKYLADTPLTAEEIAEGEARAAELAVAAAKLEAATEHRNRWFAEIDQKYRAGYFKLPSAVSQLLGISRWVYVRGVRESRTPA